MRRMPRLTGNRQLLAQLVTNLLENALKYVPTGGHVRVGVRNLPGVSRAERGRRRPGYRAGGPRGGTAALRARGRCRGARLGQRPGVESRGGGRRACTGAQLTLGDNAPGLIVHCEFPAAARREAPKASHRSNETPIARITPGAAGVT